MPLEEFNLQWKLGYIQNGKRGLVVTAGTGKLSSLTLHNTWTTIDPDYDGCEVLLVEVDRANHLSLLAGKALLSSVIVIAIAPLSLASSIQVSER